MKKFLSIFIMLTFALAMWSQTENKAQIKFEKTSHDFGTFSEKSGPQTVVFVFTNVGDAPLIIEQAIASCGCTVPSFTKTPVKPGEKGEIKVTYNGAGKWPGEFTKTINVRSNGSSNPVRLYIKGNMTEE